jgi:hypothetical protein
MALAQADEVFNLCSAARLNCLITLGLRTLLPAGVEPDEACRRPVDSEKKENRSESKSKLAEPLTSPAKVPTRDPSLKLSTKPAGGNLDLI